jgi:hypothetical protein
MPMLSPLEQPRALMSPGNCSSADTYPGMPMGGGDQWPFRASAIVEGENKRIQPASFLSAEEAWTASMSERADRDEALSKHGTAHAPRPHADQRPCSGALAWGQGQQQHNDANEAEQPMAAECMAAAGGGRTSHEEGLVEQAAATHRTSAAAAERGSKKDCAQYVGVFYDERKSGTKPFRANIYFGSKTYHICGCATAEAAARAYDAIARMIPNRKLNFLTTSSAAAFGAVPSNGAGAIPSESELLAAIVAIRPPQQARQPQEARGEIKYFGVWRTKASARPFKAEICVDGKKKNLGRHPTAEAAARAYDVVARKIPGRTLNFTVASASTPEARVQAAASSHAGLATPSDSAQPIEQQVQPSSPQLAPAQPGTNDIGDDSGCFASAKELARCSKRMRSSSPVMQHPEAQLRQPLLPLQLHYHQQPPASSAPTAQPLSSLQLFLAAAYDDNEPLDGLSPFIVVDLSFAD